MQKLAFVGFKLKKKLCFSVKNPKNPYNLRHYPYFPYNPYNFLVKKNVQSVHLGHPVNYIIMRIIDENKLIG